MKILCTADIHIGQQAYSKIDPNTGLNNRIQHGLDILDDMIDYAIKNCEVFIFAGDMFKNNLPTPTIQDEVYKRIKRLDDNNIKTFILDGNHDVSKLETAKSSLKAFNTFDLKNIKHTRFNEQEEYKGINFVFLPTYTTREQIQNIVKGIDKPSIVIGHFTVCGAMLNDWLVDTSELNASINDFDNPNVKAVVLGHLHKHQILNAKPLIFYTGSPDRIDFGEENDIKNFVVLDTDDYSAYKIIETNAQKFTTIKIDISNIFDVDINDYIYQKVNEYDVEDSIVRVTIILNSVQDFDEQLIYNALNNNKAQYIINIKKQYIEKKYVRNSSVNEDLSMENALKEYYKDDDRKDERIKLGMELINIL